MLYGRYLIRTKLCGLTEIVSKVRGSFPILTQPTSTAVSKQFFSFLGKTAFFQSVPAPCIRLVTLETLSELSPRPKTTTSQHPSALHDQSVAKKFTKGQGAMEYVVW